MGMTEFEREMTKLTAESGIQQKVTTSAIKGLNGRFDVFDAKLAKVDKETAVNAEKISAGDKEHKRLWKKVNGLCKPPRKLLLTAASIAAVVAGISVLLDKFPAFWAWAIR